MNSWIGKINLTRLKQVLWNLFLISLGSVLCAVISECGIHRLGPCNTLSGSLFACILSLFVAEYTPVYPWPEICGTPVFSVQHRRCGHLFSGLEMDSIHTGDSG